MRTQSKKTAATPSTPSTNTLAEKASGFFDVFHHAPGVMCFSTYDSIIVEANESFVTMFGYTRDEFIGMNLKLLSAGNEEKLIRNKKLLREKGKLVNEELKCVHKNGSSIYCLVNASELTISGIDLILVSFNDIGQLKQHNQNLALERKNLFDSVSYAKRIQDAILPPEELIKKTLPESFVVFKPKAVVSGDFYWVETRDTKIYVAVADCTGHGVPGALLSIAGFNLLNESLKRGSDTKPSDILNTLSNGVYKMLRQNSTNWGVKDGMEISVIVIDRQNSVLEYSGARRPLYIVRQNELLKLSADRFPIGFHTGQHLQKFSNYEMPLKKGDILYLFTDGYTNQFGGAQRKKFGSLQFQQFLLSFQHLDLLKQKQALEEKFEIWKGTDEDQIDDILIMGIKI